MNPVWWTVIKAPIVVLLYFTQADIVFQMVSALFLAGYAHNSEVYIVPCKNLLS